jgi:2-phosphosulfolactate phosphatase
VFEDARGDLLQRLMNCSSGREVSARGYEDDVLLASELDVSTTVPRLRGESFVSDQ